MHVNTLSDSEHVDVNEVIARLMQERALRTPETGRPQIREIGTGRPAADRSVREARKE